MGKVTNLILVGTGGQGIVLASRIIAWVAFKSGFDVKESEIHGMAQRGGSVIGHLRFGEKVYSPIIPFGSADILLSLEELEALRYLQFLKKDGILILNRKKILPAGITEEAYPQNVEEILKEKGFKVKSLNAEEVAKELGSLKIENTVLLGCLSICLPFKKGIWEEVISSAVPPNTVELNLKAFNKGREIGGMLFLEQKD
jgi:indolepyruvate ferredoxin oxidoreductase beta subunit